MKNKKIMILLPILFVVSAIGILLIRQSYSAPAVMQIASSYQRKEYIYIRRNMLSHHMITNNYDPSGTIILKTDSAWQVYGERQIVYCAHKGQNIAAGSDGHRYYNVPIDQTSVAVIKNAKSRLIGVMSNSYPYISLSDLKTRIKNGIGVSEYNRYKFDTLDAQEAMTATQAAIWNAIDGNNRNSRYSGTQWLGSIQYKYMHRANGNTWPINWDNVGSYDINYDCYRGPGCDAKSTYLASGDTAQSAGSFKWNDANTLVGDRINRLIDWYFTLNESSIVESSLPKFSVQAGSDSWSDAGKTLTVTILSNNKQFKYDAINNYNITFKDLAGKVLSPTSSTKVTDGGVVIGYKYVINNIDTKGVTATATATIPSENSNVYIYEADVAYANTQYLIGVESGDVPVSTDLQILNNATAKAYVYKTNKENEDSTPQVTYGSKKDDICGSGNPCFSGAQFVIYAEDQTTVIKRFETTTTASEISLPLGTYYIQEIAAPTGYTLNESKVKFELKEESTIAAIHYNDVPTKVCIKKVSTEDGNTVLDGARIQLQSMLGGLYVDFTTSQQEENNGIYCTTPAQLPVGYYYIVETSAPANFIKPNTRYRIKVGNFNEDDIAEEKVLPAGVKVEDVQLQTIDGIKNVAVIQNKPGTVISKSDLATGGCVEGAHLVIKDNKTGKQVDEWTSTCEEGNDNHTVELSEGSYTLVEETAPGGYATAESIEFTVDSHGKASTSLDMKDAPIEACFKKVSKNNQDGLPGAEFEIYNEKGELYNKFTSSNAATCFQYMPVGKYRIKETKAPDGYQKLEKDIEVEVKDTNETQEFEINNEVNAPKTALNGSQMVIIIASIFMVVGLGLVGYYGYKKQI